MTPTHQEPPNFNAISPAMHKQAWQAWNDCDAAGLFALASHQARGDLIFDNLRPLQARGMIEAALVLTYTHGPHLRRLEWEALFYHCDREKLAACGDAIPSGPLTVFRGINNAKKRSFIRGLSWTTHPGTAAWFANRHRHPGDDPAVYSMTVQPEDVLFVTNDRAEAEVVVAAWNPSLLPKRLRPMPAIEKLAHPVR